MSVMLRRNRSTFYTKLFHWEYWPTWIIYFPVFLYYLLLSLKARNFFFFSMANPEMEMGGLYNCSKNKQLKKIPSAFKPRTLYVKPNTQIQEVLIRLSSLNLNFPLVAKPDRGERGVGVSLLHSYKQLKKYLHQTRVDFLIQEYIDSPFEAGVFYYRIPGQSTGTIPSLVVKSFLTIRGDGYSTVKELILQNPRARLIATKLLAQEGINPDEILPGGIEKLLEPIGNHNRGTKFMDGNHLCNEDLIYFFDALSYHIPNFYYGRFDLKAASEEDFKKGWGIKILEVNGVNAEPAHIYDPNAKFWKGVRTLLHHWKVIYAISMENKKRRFKPASFDAAWTHFKEWKTQK